MCQVSAICFQIPGRIILKTKSKGIAHDTFSNICVEYWNNPTFTACTRVGPGGSPSDGRMDGKMDGTNPKYSPNFIAVGMIIKTHFAKDRQYGDIV